MRDRPSAAATRFELLARELEQQIAAGVLRPGDRLPSVRQTCASRGAEPEHGVPGLLPARIPRPRPRGATLGLLRRRTRRRCAARRARNLGAPVRIPAGRGQRPDLRVSRLGARSRHRALRFRVPEPGLVSSRPTAPRAGLQHAAARTLEHGRGPAAGQPAAQARDRQALPASGHDRGHRRDRADPRCDGGAEPVPERGGAAG